uniref:uncharacterized protein LOC122605731 n=1 Tax=Erigeron canadensis TaxID=72917 RepID=UPI001CB9278E|nr:uncharacterized protein LOC122605731 [Erigeron canadensis]
MGDAGIPVTNPADDINPETINFKRIITTLAFSFQCVRNIFNETRRILVRQYPRVVAYAEQVGGDILPSPALWCIVKLLLPLVQIKAQLLSGTPSTTHHRFMIVWASIVILYALFCAVETALISCLGYNHTSLSVVVARLEVKFLGIGQLYIDTHITIKHHFTKSI